VTRPVLDRLDQVAGRSGGQRRKLRAGALDDQGEDAAGGGQVLGGYPAPDAGGDGGPAQFALGTIKPSAGDRVG
jgi:hypothetical protein